MVWAATFSGIISNSKWSGTSNRVAYAVKAAHEAVELLRNADALCSEIQASWEKTKSNNPMVQQGVYVGAAAFKTLDLFTSL